MTVPTVTRGRVTVMETGFTKNFLFNPSEITDLKNVNWGQLDVPGASHPIYQYGTGGERSISFELYLDGDRGRYDRLDAQDDISIESELKFYRSLVYPARYNDTFEAVYPNTLLFSFGQYIDNLHCIMKGAPSVRILHFTPKLQPVRATVQITLAELTEKSQTSEDIYPTAQVGPVSSGVQLDPVFIQAGIGNTNGGGRVRVGQARIIQRLGPTTINGSKVQQVGGFTQLSPTNIASSKPAQLDLTTITSGKAQTLPPTTIKASARPVQLASQTVYARKRT